MKVTPTKHPGEVLLALNRRDEPMLAAASSEAKSSPFRLKKILVPIDFSDCAKKALRYAIPLAKQHEADLALLYVVPMNYAVGEYGGIDYAALEVEMRSSGEKELSTLVAA
jgi:nucleotide-binding universal stress UspA family protein